jgi:FkbM family methyltransferase
VIEVETSWAFLLRALLRPWPSRVQLNVARRLYGLDSVRVRGFDAVVPYLGRSRFALNTKDLIGWRIFFTGQYERETNHVLRCFCQPGDIVVEAGANNGSETVLLANLVGPTGEVYAFEPVPHVRAQLEANIRLNALEAIVQVESLALAESAGEADFFVMPVAASNQGMSSRFFFPGSQGKVPVVQVRLDCSAG